MAALDAETGKELWRFDGEAYKLGQLLSGSGWKLRGTAFWRDRGTVVNLSEQPPSAVFQLDAADRESRSRSFGKDGWGIADGRHGTRVAESTHVTQSSPPVIYKDLVILGSQVPDRVQLRPILVG